MGLHTKLKTTVYRKTLRVYPGTGAVTVPTGPVTVGRGSVMGVATFGQLLQHCSASVSRSGRSHPTILTDGQKAGSVKHLSVVQRMKKRKHHQFIITVEPPIKDTPY